MTQGLRAAKSGLTLLEALVALAIIGSAFGAVLELQAQLVRGLDTVASAHARAAWRHNVTEIASMISQDAERVGAIEWPDGARLAWSPATGPSWSSPNRVGMRQRGAWRVTLAPVAFTVTSANGLVLKTDRLVVSAQIEAAPPP